MDTSLDTSNTKWNPFHLIDHDGKPNWKSIKGVLIATIILLVLLTFNSMYLYTPRPAPTSPRPTPDATSTTIPTVTIAITITATPTFSIPVRPSISSTP